MSFCHGDGDRKAKRSRQPKRPRESPGAYDPGRLTLAAKLAGKSAAETAATLMVTHGKGCAESFIRTLEENLLWVRTSQTVEELRLNLIAFKRIYNESWLIERHGHRSPAQLRRDQPVSQPMAA